MVAQLALNQLVKVRVLTSQPTGYSSDSRAPGLGPGGQWGRTTYPDHFKGVYMKKKEFKELLISIDQAREMKELDVDSISICPYCYCMTYTIKGKCGKCKKKKADHEKYNTSIFIKERKKSGKSAST